MPRERSTDEQRAYLDGFAAGLSQVTKFGMGTASESLRTIGEHEGYSAAWESMQRGETPSLGRFAGPGARLTAEHAAYLRAIDEDSHGHVPHSVRVEFVRRRLTANDASGGTYLTGPGRLALDEFEDDEADKNFHGDTIPCSQGGAGPEFGEVTDVPSP